MAQTFEDEYNQAQEQVWDPQALAERQAYLASPEGVLATRAQQLSGDYGYTRSVKPENVMAIQGIIEQLGGKESLSLIHI